MTDTLLTNYFFSLFPFTYLTENDQLEISLQQRVWKNILLVVMLA